MHRRTNYRSPDGFDPEWDAVVWTTDTYIASYQIRSAFRDPDVIVGDIETEESSPSVRLLIQDNSSEQNWPTAEHDRLANTATVRFRQHDHRPGWADESSWEMLRSAEQNAYDARFALEAGDAHSMEEHMADALNYMLFALDIELEES